MKIVKMCFQLIEFVFGLFGSFVIRHIDKVPRFMTALGMLGRCIRRLRGGFGHWKRGAKLLWTG
jgi:hypothetical protein